MKIYTYFDDIEFKNQEELIDLWKHSWKKQGFDAQALSLDNAKAHPYFDEYNQRLRKVHEQIMDKEISDYGMSCYYRWLAYASLKDSSEFYVSDYDVININYKPMKPNKGLNLMVDLCPCFASGNSEDFLNFCKFFVIVSEKRKKVLRGNILLATGKPSPSYHDQDLLINNLNQNNPTTKKWIESLNLNISRNHEQVGKDFSLEGENSNAIHFSRNSISKSQDKINIDKLRIFLIKSMLRK